MFDVGYYLNNNVSVRKDGMDVILHYLYFGYDKGFKPSKYFNPSEYLSLNSDIKLNGMNPLVHYLLYGQYENRKIISLKNMFKNDKKVSNNKTNTKSKTHKSQKISFSRI